MSAKGQRKTINGVEYVLNNNSRWERATDKNAQKSKIDQGVGLSSPMDDFAPTHVGTGGKEETRQSLDEETLRAVDKTGEFKEYLLMERGISETDYYEDYDDEEKDDLLAEFINNDRGSTVEDYDRVAEELSSYEFSRVKLSKTAEVNSQTRKDKKKRDKYIADGADPSVDYPYVEIDDLGDDDLLELNYRYGKENGEERFFGFDSFRDYLNSYEAEEDSAEIYNDRQRQLREMTKEWSSRTEGDFVRIDGKGIGWQNLSGTRVFPKDEFLSRFKQTQPDTELNQTWVQKSDGTLELVQSHHDSPTGEFYKFTAMTKKELRKNNLNPEF